MSERVEPSDICPMFVWGFLQDPATIEGERQIRADQRRLDFRELQATASTLRYLIDRLDLDSFRPQDRATLDQIHRITRQLKTHIERRAAA